MKLDILDSCQFTELWLSSQLRNPFHSPHVINLTLDKGALIFYYVVSDDSGSPLYLYPCLLTPLQSYPGSFKASSSYGYSGITPYSDSVNLDTLCYANRLITDDLLTQSVVTEFERCQISPFPSSRNSHSLNNLRLNIGLNITSDYSKLYASYHRSVKKALRRANSNSLYYLSTIDEDNCCTRDPSQLISAFIDIYSQTMVRRHADAYYDFDSFLFDSSIRHSVQHGYGFLSVVYSSDHRALAAEWTLLSYSSAFSFLGGSSLENDDHLLRPAEYMKDSIIKDLSCMNSRLYVLGGGKADYDGIFNFKSRFTSLYPFHSLSTRTILNKPLFKELSTSSISSKSYNVDYFPPFS